MPLHSRNISNTFIVAGVPEINRDMLRSTDSWFLLYSNGQQFPALPRLKYDAITGLR